MVDRTSPPFATARIVGTGLLGTSVGLALREQNVHVTLEDSSPSISALAADYGAGKVASENDPDPSLVVVATPPDVTADVVATQLERFPHAVVIDVASVKRSVLDSLRQRDADVSRYVGTHPMAGREKGGPTAARVDLFTGRPWVVCAHDENAETTVKNVSDLIGTLGGSVHEMDASLHDQAVALVSHLPQVVASTVASTLLEAGDDPLSLAGQGLRDVTRIAASDPGLWGQILTHNAQAVAPLLERVGQQLLEQAAALGDLGRPGAKKAIAENLQHGLEGVSRLPGKHGGSQRFANLTVIIDDTPGQLAQLLKDVGELGVNLEDMRLEHSPGAPVGFVELAVVPDRADSLESDLQGRGWRIAGDKK